MATAPVPQHRRFRDTKVSRFLQARWRLLFGTLLCVALVVLLPQEKHWLASRLLIGWDAGVALYLVLVIVMIIRSAPDRVRLESPLQDEGRIAIPILTVTALRASAPSSSGCASQSEIILPGILGLLFLTIVLSWLFIHMMFALRYAHEYYAEHRGAGGGLRFPGRGDPGYWDFIYFAFAIGTATQVSDVAVTSTTIRRTVTAHGMVAFVFNVTMIALTVSIAGDAISMK
jgi:uncharacterized membrane protein